MAGRRWARDGLTSAEGERKRGERVQGGKGRARERRGKREGERERPRRETEEV